MSLHQYVYTSYQPQLGSVLCGGGLCHATRMCGSVLWVLRKSARSSTLSAGLITAWKHWGQQERHAGILPRSGHCSLFKVNNPRKTLARLLAQKVVCECRLKTLAKRKDDVTKTHTELLINASPFKRKKKIKKVQGKTGHYNKILILLFLFIDLLQFIF